jgi:hypothetical protein
MPGHRAGPCLGRNVHFLNADNDEIGGLCQNGSLTWAEISEWMQIVFELPLDEYAPFPCLEHGDPKDPIHVHGPPINILGNPSRIEPGFYVLLSSEGNSVTDSIHTSILTSFRFPSRCSNKPGKSYSSLCYKVGLKT